MPADRAKTAVPSDFARLPKKGPVFFGDSSQNSARYPRMKDLIGTSFSTGERAVFAALCDYANPKHDMWPSGALRVDGFAAWPSVKTIMEITGMTDRGVQKAIDGLEAGGAIRCIYHSKGGGSVKGDRGRRNSTNCYLLTPNSVHRDTRDRPAKAIGESEIHTKNDGISISPKSANVNPFTAPPNSVHRPPELSSPPTPELSSPEYSNHHHQGEETNESLKHRATATLANGVSFDPEETRPTNANASQFSFSDDDDDRGHKLRTLADPREEFRARLQNRRWMNGPAECEGIVQTICEALKNDPSRISRFLDYEESLTTPHKIRNPGGHYRELLKSFIAAEPSSRIEQQRKRATADQNGDWGAWRCSHDKGCKMGLIEDVFGHVAMCSCAADMPDDKRQSLRNTVERLGIMRGLGKRTA